VHHPHCQPHMHMSRKSTRSLKYKSFSIRAMVMNADCAFDIIEANLLPLDLLLGHANHKAHIGTMSLVKLHCSQGLLDRSEFDNHAVRHQHLNSKNSHNLPCRCFYTSTTDLRGVKNLKRCNKTGRHTHTGYSTISKAHNRTYCWS